MPGARGDEDRVASGAVLFLAFDDAAYINATTLMVDGGATVYMPSTRSPEAALAGANTECAGIRECHQS